MPALMVDIPLCRGLSAFLAIFCCVAPCCVRESQASGKVSAAVAAVAAVAPPAVVNLT